MPDRFAVVDEIVETYEMLEPLLSISEVMANEECLKLINGLLAWTPDAMADVVAAEGARA